MEFNGCKVISDLLADYIVVQQVSIQEGWYLWSTYIEPSDMDMSSIINPIVDNTVIVKDWQGSVYWPSLNINTIGNIVNGQGYQIKSDQSTVLNIRVIYCLMIIQLICSVGLC